jgi:hypothetical protein
MLYSHMKVFSTKTVRFTALVQASGQPEVANLWTRPEEDKPFMKAVRENRVLTVKQENLGSSKDFGVVGFLREKNVSYLVFPKSLEKFKDRRVIGIKYDLVRTGGPLGKVVKQRHTEKRGWGRGVMPHEWATSSEAAPEARHTETKSTALKKFKVMLRFISTVEVTAQVEAKDRSKAARLALKTAGSPDFTKGTITSKILKVSPAR